MYVRLTPRKEQSTTGLSTSPATKGGDNNLPTTSHTSTSTTTQTPSQDPTPTSTSSSTETIAKPSATSISTDTSTFSSSSTSLTSSTEVGPTTTPTSTTTEEPSSSVTTQTGLSTPVNTPSLSTTLAPTPSSITGDPTPPPTPPPTTPKPETSSDPSTGTGDPATTLIATSIQGTSTSSPSSPPSVPIPTPASTPDTPPIKTPSSSPSVPIPTTSPPDTPIKTPSSSPSVPIPTSSPDTPPIKTPSSPPSVSTPPSTSTPDTPPIKTPSSSPSVPTATATATATATPPSSPPSATPPNTTPNSSPLSPGQPFTSILSPSSSPGVQPTILQSDGSSSFAVLIGSATTNLLAQPTTNSEATPVPSSFALDNNPGDGSLTTEVVETAVVTSGVESITATSTAADGAVAVFTTMSSFTRTVKGTTTIVTTRPTVSANLDTKSKTGSIVGGVISGVLGLILILVAALCFLRKRRRARSSPNQVPYSPVERGDSPYAEETRQLPPIRTITPLVWPVNPSHTPEPHADATDNDTTAATQLRAAGASNNPFTKLVDVPSVRLSRRTPSDGSNPFEGDSNSQYWLRSSSGTSLDPAYPESEMLDHGRTPSSVTAAEKTPADNLSVISHCPYPVLEPDAEKAPRHLSVKSGLSYATLTAEQIRKREGGLSRSSSTSSFSSGHVVNVGYAI